MRVGSPFGGGSLEAEAAAWLWDGATDGGIRGRNVRRGVRGFVLGTRDARQVVVCIATGGPLIAAANFDVYQLAKPVLLLEHGGQGGVVTLGSASRS